jgi:hypothetical protein
MTDLFTYAEAKFLRDKGLARSALHTEIADKGFGDRAYAVLVDLACKQSTVHVDDFLSATSLRPSHPNAMGAVWMRAIKNGVLERTGLVRPCAVDKKKHAHQYPVYRSLIFRR